MSDGPATLSGNSLRPACLALAGLALVFGMALPLRANAHCFDLASRQYAVPAALLRAIAQQESALNPRAVNTNRNGSVDMGLMQINSQWLGVLRRHGISARDLWDPCVNVLVGAWILANNFARMGFNAQALGAYNSSEPAQRERYARQVLKRLPFDIFAPAPGNSVPARISGIPPNRNNPNHQH